MRLSETYIKEILLNEFWGQVEEDLQINEGDSGLSNLLAQADKIIFQKFGITPESKEYFIAGSARLYIHPTLREAFGLEGTIGDLDIVIPNKDIWIKAGLEKNWNEGGIYRPTKDGSIEAFNVWDPSKAGVTFEEGAIRPTQQILAESKNINGYNFMPLKDIMAYKTRLNRDKEKDIVNLITKYQQSNIKNKSGFLRLIVRLIGLDKAKEFLDNVRKT